MRNVLAAETLKLCLQGVGDGEGLGIRLRRGDEEPIVFRSAGRDPAKAFKIPPVEPPDMTAVTWSPQCYFRELVYNAMEESDHTEVFCRSALVVSAAKALWLASTLVPGLERTQRLVEGSPERFGLGNAGCCLDPMQPPHEAVWACLLRALIDPGVACRQDAYLALKKEDVLTRSTIAAVSAQSGRVLAARRLSELDSILRRSGGERLPVSLGDTTDLESDLSAICPWLANAVETVASGTPVSARLGEYTDPVRTEIWLQLAHARRRRHYPANIPACLSARRSISSWLIENVEGDLFFFPPAILKADAFVTPSALALQLPLIRRPARGYDFNHPYVGPLCRTREVSLHSEAMSVSLPAGVKHVFQDIERRRRSQPAERSFCIQGLRSMVLRANEGLDRCTRTSRNDALREGFNEILMLARQAATTSHRNNAHSQPMIHLTPGKMSYTWPTWQHPVPDALRARIFTYDGRRWTPGSRPSS